jgi:hypothetical protein
MWIYVTQEGARVRVYVLSNLLHIVQTSFASYYICKERKGGC